MTKTGMFFGGLAIVALVGAVAVAVENGGLTTLFSSTATSPGVDRAETPITSEAPARQPGVEQPGAIEPVPAPSTAQLPPPPTAQLPAPTSPAPVSSDPTSVASTAPARAADVLVPDAGNAARRTALTAEEKDAIARGLKELGLSTASATASPQSERAITAELNRKALADRVAEAARSEQLQAQNQP
jgi:hypothetical protein